MKISKIKSCYSLNQLFSFILSDKRNLKLSNIIFILIKN